MERAQDARAVVDPVWTAKELAPDAYRVRVSSEEHTGLLGAVQTARAWHELRRADVPAASAALWRRIRRCLGHTAGFCVVSGLPFDGEPELARRVTFLVGYGLGTPIFQDAQGARLIDIRSTDTSLFDSVAYTPRADGTHARPYETRAAFRLHSDACDVAGLFCIQAASSGGGSAVVSALAVYRRIQQGRPDLLEVLEQPFYYARPKKPDEPRGWHGIPVFSFRDGYCKSHIVPDLILASQLAPEVPRLSSLQREALQYLVSVADAPELRLEFRLEPGQLLLLDNHLVWHGRDEYEDAAGSTRHLLRLWLATPDSRPLDPVHEPWFGNPEPGALRGGYLRERLAELADAPQRSR
jgi:hypothetical protein